MTIITSGKRRTDLALRISDGRIELSHFSGGVVRACDLSDAIAAAIQGDGAYVAILRDVADQLHCQVRMERDGNGPVAYWYEESFELRSREIGFDGECGESGFTRSFRLTKKTFHHRPNKMEEAQELTEILARLSAIGLGASRRPCTPR